ncbi:MAG: beta-hydroxyacid dehydrogenase, 3-hydroxyisobutyrate dehydrogenase [Conexibacter sp.]|nr:beta-hydroxyacid dehydrogenase, 3-hydroxyisobutyrate dehydrogenase [Conexibacter sp.]
MDAPRHIGVLGLGAIGGGVARSLAAAGFRVVFHDVNPETQARYADVGAGVESPRAVAEQADVVLVAVFDDAQVREVLTGPSGLLTGETSMGDVVILSTVTLDTIRWADAACRTHGVTVLDCGVTGGPQALERHSIVAMVGGPGEAVARLGEMFAAFSDPTVHTGPLGTGMQAKLARNLLYFAGCHVAWEAARLAAAAGVSVEKLIAIADASDRWTGGSTAILKRGFRPDLEPAQSPEDQARRERMAGFAHKDLLAALRLGAELGVDLPAAALAEDRFDQVVGLPARGVTPPFPAQPPAGAGPVKRPA